MVPLGRSSLEPPCVDLQSFPHAPAYEDHAAKRFKSAASEHQPPSYQPAPSFPGQASYGSNFQSVAGQGENEQAPGFYSREPEVYNYQQASWPSQGGAALPDAQYQAPVVQQSPYQYQQQQQQQVYSQASQQAYQQPYQQSASYQQQPQQQQQQYNAYYAPHAVASYSQDSFQQAQGHQAYQGSPQYATPAAMGYSNPPAPPAASYDYYNGAASAQPWPANVQGSQRQYPSFQ
jgi:hypothetical protein